MLLGNFARNHAIFSSLLKRNKCSVPHPFAFFLAKGWETAKVRIAFHPPRVGNAGVGLGQGSPAIAGNTTNLQGSTNMLQLAATKLQLATVCERRWIQAIPAESGRRRDHSRRPPTPPDVRFRIRRFMKQTGSVAEFPATKPAPCGRTRTWDRLRSCARRRRSTTGRARWWPTATPAFVYPSPHQILRSCIDTLPLPP